MHMHSYTPSHTLTFISPVSQHSLYAPKDWENRFSKARTSVILYSDGNTSDSKHCGSFGLTHYSAFLKTEIYITS